MHRILALVAATVALAACADDRLTPAPGQAPGWPGQSPPRPSHAPLPFQDTYLPATAIQVMPPVAPGHNVPYAVPPEAGPAPGAVAAPTTTTPAPAQACHTVPPVTFEGKPARTVCPQADGTWVYIPD